MDINIVSRADISMGLDDLNIIENALYDYINNDTYLDQARKEAKIIRNKILDATKQNAN